MSNSRLVTFTLRCRFIAGACGVVTASACSQPPAVASATERVQVRIDSMGVAGFSIPGLSLLMYADGAATVDFGSGPLRSLADTIRFSSAPSSALDVSAGTVHVEMVGGELPGGGVISLSGFVVGVDSVRMRAVGRHLAVEKGGTGIRVVDRGNEKLMR